MAKQSKHPFKFTAPLALLGIIITMLVVLLTFDKNIPRTSFEIVAKRATEEQSFHASVRFSSVQSPYEQVQDSVAENGVVQLLDPQTVILQEDHTGLYIHPPDLSASSKRVNGDTGGSVNTGDVLTYTVVLNNRGSGNAYQVRLFDAIPYHTTYVPNSARVVPSLGQLTPTENCIEWQGDIASGTSIVVSFRVTVDQGVMDGEIITNVAEISCGGSTIRRSAAVTVEAQPPFFWGFSCTNWVTDTQRPNCTVQVQDIAPGLNVDTISYRFSTDEGANWRDGLSISCTGSNGTTAPQECTAHDIPFDQDSITKNQIEFRIQDMCVTEGTSGPYTVMVDTTEPEWRNFRLAEMVTTTAMAGSLTCTINAQDLVSGLKIDSAYYSYSVDGENGWGNWHTLSCLGTDGTTDLQECTVADVPFDSNFTRIRFKINDIANNVRESKIYVVPYPVYLPLATKNHCSLPDYECYDSCENAYGPLLSGQRYYAYAEDTEDYYYFDLDATKIVTVTGSDYNAVGQALLYKACPANEANRIAYMGLTNNPTTLVRTLPKGRIIVRIYTSDNYNTSRYYVLQVTY